MTGPLVREPSVFPEMATVVIAPTHDTMIGGDRSTTSTKRLQLAELPASSSALKVTLVTPRGKLLPETGPETSVGMIVVFELSMTIGLW